MVIAPEIFEIRPPSSLNELGQTANGTFYWPRGIAVNSTGFIFVADTQNSRGQIFDDEGTFVSTFGFPGNNATDGSMNQPFGIFINQTSAVDGQTDYVYVADTFTNVIKVYNHTGVYNSTIGTTGGGTGTGAFYYPSGVATNSTHLFVADTYNNRIIIMNFSGNTEDTIPE